MLQGVARIGDDYEMNGIPLGPMTCRLLFLPIDHLMKHTLLACAAAEVPHFYRDVYAKDVWDPDGKYAASVAKANRIDVMREMLETGRVYLPRRAA